MTLQKEQCYKCKAEILVCQVYPDKEEKKVTGLPVHYMDEHCDYHWIGWVCWACSDKIENSSFGYPPASITVYPKHA